MSLETPREKVRNLQRKLYDKAKAEPTFRFYSLYDKIYCMETLRYAYRRSKAKGLATGVDGETYEQIEKEGLEIWLGRLQEDLRTRRYEAQAVRRHHIEKPGGGQRPLGIPTIRDRVAQGAAALVLMPIFEADFPDEMYGYRPGRSTKDAIKAVHNAVKDGYTEVLDADLSKYFDTIPHDELLKSVARRISDGAVLHLIKLWLTAPVEERDEETGKVTRSGGKDHHTGTPQGGVASPLLANIYMSRFFRAWKERGMDKKLQARAINYADDFVILSRGRGKAVHELTRDWMTRLKLTLNEKKTCLRDARRETFDFLGYTFGPLVHRPTGRTYQAARPSKKATARLKDKLREILKPGNMGPKEAVAARVNSVLRGWANAFDYGTVARTYWKLNAFVWNRVRRFLARRNQLSTRGHQQYGWKTIFGELGILLLRPPKSAAP